MKDEIILRLKNNGKQPLKIAVFDIEPTWAVAQIDNINDPPAPYFDLSNGDSHDIKLAMTIPDDQAYDRTKEMLKIFAVQKGLADFRWLALPPLDELPETREAKLEKDLESAVQATRSMGEPEGVNPLNNLLKMIGADLDKAPNVTRAATVVVDPKQEWVTKQIQIVVER